MSNMKLSMPHPDKPKTFMDESQFIPWYIIDPTGEQIVKQRELTRKFRDEALQAKMTKEERVALEKAPKTLKMRLKRSLSNATLFPFWDLVTSIALIFTAIVTPFEVGFMEASAVGTPLFTINRVVDIIFILDMCISFFLMQKVDTRKRTDRQWEMRLHKLVVGYLTGWFTLDVVSIAPSIFDIMSATSTGDGDDVVPKSARGVMRTSKSSALISEPRPSPCSSRL